MKICSKCQRELSEDSFAFKNKRKSNYHSICKECKRDYNKIYYQNNSEVVKKNTAPRRKRQIKENRKFVWDYINSHDCLECGEPNPMLLEFAHRDPSNKSFNMASGTSRGLCVKTLQAEMDKCDLLCVKCHRLKTAEEQNWWAEFLAPHP